jgi:hypothetical protein
MGGESFKRKGPKPLTPLKINGVRYTEIRDARSRGYDQPGGIVAAIDEKTGNELWSVLVYQTQYDKKEESDVQDVFITSIEVSPDGMSLLVTNERKRRFSINLSDHSVKPLE